MRIAGLKGERILNSFALYTVNIARNDRGTNPQGI